MSPADRKEIILREFNVKGRGIEIGPSHSPIASRRDGYNVKIIDVLDQKGLREKYATHGVDLDAIEAVDFVWRGERYPDLVPPPHQFDWIIASHVIEHTPDLVAFLNDCDQLLSSTGVLSLAIPDKRFCFDRFRPISGLADVLDSHGDKRISHSPGKIAEYMLNATSRGGQIAWDPSMRDEYRFLCTEGDVRAHYQGAVEGRIQIDLHSWCFTPSSFRLILHDLAVLGLTRFRERSFHAPRGSEFFISLEPSDRPLLANRLDLLSQIEAELREA